MHAQQLLRRHAVGLVQQDLDLLQAARQGGYATPELIRDVELVGIKEENYHCGVIDEPSYDLFEVVPSLQALLLAGQHSRCIDEGHALEDWAGDPCTLEPA